jgi:hypothetical protein
VDLSLYGDFDEGYNGIYNVDNFLGIVTLGISFPDGDIEVEWCRHHGINFSHFSILSWLDPTIVKDL